METKIDMEFWMDPSNMKVKRGSLTTKDGYISKIGCHHKGEKSYGYCGGCAARIYFVMNVVEALLKDNRSEDALAVIKTMRDAQRGEVP